MITYRQLILRGRVYRRAHCWSPGLLRCPQVRGRVRRFYTTTPRKPNSAKRAVAKIRLSNGKGVIAKLPGEGHPPGKHSVVLVRGHGYKDTPGVGYTMIRGALECISLFNKRRRRSIYGARRV